MNAVGLSRRRAKGGGLGHGRLPMLVLGLVLVLGLYGCGGDSPTVNNTPTPPPVANYAGTWSGSYRASDCGHTGPWPPCSDIIAGVASMSLTLTQTGSAITGTLAQGGLIAGNLNTTVNGSVTADGHLVLNGTTNVTVSGLPLTVAIAGWDTTQSGNSMTGVWSDHLTSIAVPGFVQWLNTLSAAKGAANPPVALSRERGQGEGMIEELLGLRGPGAR